MERGADRRRFYRGLGGPVAVRGALFFLSLAGCNYFAGNLCEPCLGACGPGLSCLEGICVSSAERCGLDVCSAEITCPAGQYCDGRSCIDGCGGGPPCAVGERCLAERCEGPQQASVGPKAGCSSWSDGRVSCWGIMDLLSPDDPAGMAEPRWVEGIDDAVEVKLGHEHACALTRTGEVKCWGRNHVGQLNKSSWFVAFNPVASGADITGHRLWVGPYHNCVLSLDGHARCWGDDNDGKTAIPPDLVFGDLALGYSVTCGDREGQAACWGKANLEPEGAWADLRFDLGTLCRKVGLDRWDCRNLDNLWRLTWVGTPPVSGRAYSLLCRADGDDVRCQKWFQHRGPHPGSRFTEVVAPPEAPPGELLVGEQLVCRHQPGAPVRCFGIPGTLGALPPMRGWVPHPQLGPVTDFAVNDARTCVVAQGQVRCAGLPLPETGATCRIGHEHPLFRNHHALVCAPTSRSYFPARAGPSGSRISLGLEHACVWDPGAAAYCWGRNKLLDDGGAILPQVAAATVAAYLPEPYQALSLGYRQTCGLLASEQAHCWGTRGSPSGNVAFDERSGGGLRQVAVSDGRRCELDLDGQVKCQVFSEDDRLKPIEQTVPMVEITLGVSHACARDRDGGVWCWGRNQNGELGNGRTFSSALEDVVPRRINWTGAAVAVTAGEAWNCLLDAEGGTWCWGQENAGNFLRSYARNAPSARVTPVKLDLPPLRQVKIAAFHGCGITFDNEFGCWGSDLHGQVSGQPPPPPTWTAIPAPRAP